MTLRRGCVFEHKRKVDQTQKSVQERPQEREREMKRAPLSPELSYLRSWGFSGRIPVPISEYPLNKHLVLKGSALTSLQPEKATRWGL